MTQSASLSVAMRRSDYVVQSALWGSGCRAIALRTKRTEKSQSHRKPNAAKKARAANVYKHAATRYYRTETQKLGDVTKAMRRRATGDVQEQVQLLHDLGKLEGRTRVRLISRTAHFSGAGVHRLCCPSNRLVLSRAHWTFKHTGMPIF